MKKYDIFLDDIGNKTPEAFDKLCREFASEFSISVSGAKILLKQLPALLEIDVSEERAENYFNFFAERGGTIQLKNRQNLENQRHEDISPLPPDDSPVEEEVSFDEGSKPHSSDFDILMGDDNGGKTQKSPTDSLNIELHDDIHTNKVEPDSIDSILEMEDEFSLSLESDDDDDLSSPLDEEEHEDNDPGYKTLVEFQEEESKDDSGGADLGVNKESSDAETVFKGNTGAETVIKPGLNESISGAQTVLKPRFDDAFKTCLSCRKSFNGHACPSCSPEESRVSSCDSTDGYDIPFTDELDSGVISRLFSKASDSDFGEIQKELPVFFTEGLLLTFIISVVSSVLFFILPQKNLLYHLLAPVIPLIGMILIFILGKISLYCKQKKEHKGTSTLVRALATPVILLTCPGQWLVLANRKLYDSQKLLFSGKKLLLMNMTFIFAAIVCLTTAVFLNKSMMFNQKETLVAHSPGKKNKNFSLHPTETSDGTIHKDSEEITQETEKQKEKISTTHLYTYSEKRPKITYSRHGKKVDNLYPIVGKRVKVTLTNRNEFIGTIIEEGRQYYTLKAHRYGGTFVFSILKNDITHIAMAPLKYFKEDKFTTSK
jgi:hypothetical protein